MDSIENWQGSLGGKVDFATRLSEGIRSMLVGVALISRKGYLLSALKLSQFDCPMAFRGKDLWPFYKTLQAAACLPIHCGQ